MKPEEPTAKELRQFIAVFNALDSFESAQREIHGYGAALPKTTRPDPACVKVLGWLAERAEAGEI